MSNQPHVSIHIAHFLRADGKAAAFTVEVQFDYSDIERPETQEVAVCHVRIAGAMPGNSISIYKLPMPPITGQVSKIRKTISFHNSTLFYPEDGRPPLRGPLGDTG